MVRILALNALFFLIPFAVYAIWLLATRRNLGTRAEWTNRMITILSVIGAVAVVIGLVVLVSFDADTTNAPYHPATIGEDGQIIPGYFGDE